VPLWLCSIIITWRHKISVTSGYIIISLQKSITGGTSIEGGCINYRGTQHLHGDMSITGSMSITCLFFFFKFWLVKSKYYATWRFSCNEWDMFCIQHGCSQGKIKWTFCIIILVVSHMILHRIQADNFKLQLQITFSDYSCNHSAYYWVTTTLSINSKCYNLTQLCLPCCLPCVNTLLSDTVGFPSQTQKAPCAPTRGRPLGRVIRLWYL